MDWHPVQGGVKKIFLVALCYINQDKRRPDGPLGSYAEPTFTMLNVTVNKQLQYDISRRFKTADLSAQIVWVEET